MLARSTPSLSTQSSYTHTHTQKVRRNERHVDPALVLVARRDASIRRYNEDTQQHLIELNDGGRSEPMWRDLRFVVFRDWALFPELRASVMRSRRVVALSSVCERRAGPAAGVMSDVLRTYVVHMLG